jgi:glycerol-3-phosphate O-acyltransferase
MNLHRRKINSKDDRIMASLYISNSLMNTGARALMGRLAGIFFRKIDFDAESINTLREYCGKGRVAYVSYQSSSAPLHILVNLLRRHGSPVPDIALDFTPSLLQATENFFSHVSFLFRKYFEGKKLVTVPDRDYIINLFRGKRAVILSVLSRRLFIRRYIDIKSDSLEYLIEAQRVIDDPIYLFPQMLFWTQDPERTRTFISTHATTDMGFFAGLFTMLTSTTPAFVRVSTPINLKEEIERSSTEDLKQISRMIRNRLLEIYTHEKRTALGPVIKSHQEMMEKVLEHKNVIDDIQLLRESERQSEKLLRKKAYRYFREIAAHFSITVLKWFHRTVRYMLNKIFDDITFDINDLQRVREAAQRGPLVLVSCHKSHMDYLIISCIFYENKIFPPFIVAGTNLTFFPMGQIFRRCGAFFMRRSFRDLKLYPTVFKQYIKTLVGEGYTIEFFIEGTRSRTGKMNAPKLGILKYLISAIEEGYNRDMIFVPITISYDRIVEESSYHMELKGKEKEAETTSAFVRSRKLLKRNYGNVYLTFNEPIAFSEFAAGLKKDEDLTESLGAYLGRRISEVVTATPFAVTSAAMLLSSAKGFSRDKLKKRFASLHDYLLFAGVRMSTTMQDAANYDEIIDYVIESYQYDDIISELSAGIDGTEGEITLHGVYEIYENERARINFYKNSITHFFLPVTFISAALLAFAQGDVMDIRQLTDRFTDLMDLFSEEFIYSEEMLDTDGVIAKYLGYLEGRSAVSRRGDNVIIVPSNRDELILFAKAAQDILESYLIVCDSVNQIRRKMSRRDLVYEVRKNGMKLYNLGDVKLSESLSMPTYDSALAKLEKSGVLEMRHVGKKYPEISIKFPVKALEIKQRVQSYLWNLQRM